ncbi:helix-turn-helix transcriptional regulator [Acidisphaera sp. L21]|uniref:helix-turn-helix domain-containing protein n=1 Tax=Acidisphaera sp. L21 TaxID=1641851 RepID=UPI00131DFD0F
MTGEECKTARIKLGWSREQLAASCGMAVSTLLNFETNRVQPRPWTVDRLKRALALGRLD